MNADLGLNLHLYKPFEDHLLFFFEPGSLPGDALGTILEGIPRNHKRKHNFFRAPFEVRFEPVFIFFAGSGFSTFSEPLFYHISGTSDAQRVQF
jgi:hypothetical protein